MKTYGGVAVSVYGSTALVNFDRFFQFLNPYTVGMTFFTGDQPVGRPLPTHRRTQIQNKRTHIHALSGIRTHDPCVRADEDGSCLRPLGHCDRQ
jgi:hypothetical protein